MSTMTRYASTAFLANLLVIALIFISLMQLFDLLSSADDIVRHHGSGVGAFAKHMILKTPEIAVAAIPFSVLLAALIVLARLANNNEVLALKASGVSYYELLLAFLPAACLVAVFYFLLCDQLAPAAQRAVDSWEAEARAANDAGKKENGGGSWLRDGNSVVHIRTVLDGGERLLGMSLSLLDEDGNLTQQIAAPEADYVDGQWRLRNAEVFTVDAAPGTQPMILPEMPWRTAVQPSQFADIAAPTETLSLADLLRFVANPRLGNRPLSVYETWLNKRIATPFAIFVMILLSAPVAQGFRRQGSLGLELAFGIGLGFLFFVADGLLLALGEAGALPPVVAAWAPMAVFGCIGTATLVRMEGY
ncbi:MAG: LPS export ABC transporter permease LptG [Rhodospirillaceae bacterium]|nr:LPS export ABC transporter permease LptG [Rhodospirillaceae bacterium]